MTTRSSSAIPSPTDTKKAPTARAAGAFSILPRRDAYIGRFLLRFDLVVVVVVSDVLPVLIAESVEVAGSAVVDVLGMDDCVDESVPVVPDIVPVELGVVGMVEGLPDMVPPVVPVCAPPGAGAICATAAVESPSAAMAAKAAIRMGLVLYCDMTFERVEGITSEPVLGPSTRRLF